MPKMPILTRREVIKALEKSGFQVVRQKGSHVQIENKNGHPGKTIGKGLLRKILHDIELTREEFIALID